MKTPALFALILTLLAPVASHAANRSWNGAVDGPFSGPGNQWSAVPGAGDVARFYGYDNGSKFTVTLTQNVENQYIRLDGAGAFEVTLDLAGHRYITNSTGNVIGRDPGDNNTLKITGNGTLEGVDVIVGSAATSNGKLVLAGTSTMTLSAESQIGAYGAGTLEITEGSRFESSAIVRVGRRNTGAGTVLITGAGSVWEAKQSVNFSNVAGATSSLSILNGGKMEATSEGTSGALNFGYAGTTTTVTVSGTDSLLSSLGSIYLAGSRTDGAGGTTHVTLSDNGRITTSTTLFLYGQGTLTFQDNTATVTARDLGSAAAALSGTIEIRLRAAGEAAAIRATRDLFLDGTNSVLTLALTDGLDYEVDNVIRLVGYSNSLTGTFSNYQEGQVVNLGDYQFLFSYTMGSGNDRFIGLTAIPEPATAGLGLLGCLGVALFHKWFSRN